MHLVYFYMYEGNDLPAYVFKSIKQCRIFNPEISIYLLTNIKLPEKYNELKIKVVDVNTLTKTPKHDNFQKNNLQTRIGQSTGYYRHFWQLSTERFFFIEELMKRDNLENVIQIECDNLVYYDFSKLIQNAIKINARHLVCGDRYNHALSNAISYFKNREVITQYTDFLNELSTKPSREEARKVFASKNQNAGQSMHSINDMCLSLLYKRLYPNRMQLWPLLPFDEIIDRDKESNENFNNFGVIVDGAHWGMHVGGWPKQLISNPSMGPGHKDASYYVGRMLIRGRLRFQWGKDEKGRKVAEAYDTKLKRATRITNLHIHCKEVDNFLSY